MLAIDAENSIYTLMADHVIDMPVREALPELVRLVVGDVGDLATLELDQ